MTAPRLEIDSGKIEHNTRTLVGLLSTLGISIAGVTKAALGCPDVARAMLRAGVSALADSRIENIEAMRREGIDAPMWLIRSPMLSQTDRVVRAADLSCNTELSVIASLSRAAGRSGRLHQVVLMVELGDLREGILPVNLNAVAGAVLGLPGIRLAGIGANLACLGGVAPDRNNMDELSTLAESVEASFGIELEWVSGGNSANLEWALGGGDPGRINHLRLGEAILLGCEPMHRRPIPELYPDAFTLVAEIIESGSKPAQPWGKRAQTAFGNTPDFGEAGEIWRVILAVGRQDVDPAGLQAPPGMSILGASGDHLVVQCDGARPAVGDEIRFGLDYSALVRAMSSPFVRPAPAGSMLLLKPDGGKSATVR